MSIASTDLQTTAIDTIRCLSMDAVQTANSGHPGTPMALAPIVYQLYNHTMKYDPAHPLWPGRDRFILSCGHASMLLYSILHLTGVKAVDHHGNVLDKPSISLDDIKKFRQVDSVCAGHPEYNEAAGIETTTGPLGKASRIPSVWRWLKLGWQRVTTLRSTSCLTTTSTRCAVMAT